MKNKLFLLGLLLFVRSTFAQCASSVYDDALGVGGSNAVPVHVTPVDVITAESFNGLYCSMPYNPALRLIITGVPYYAQLSLSNSGAHAIDNSSLAHEGDVVLCAVQATSIPTLVTTNSILLTAQSNNGSILFATTHSGEHERMRIDSVGHVGIGVTSPSQLFQVNNGNIFLSRSSGSPGQLQLQGTSTGFTTFKAGAQGTDTINYTLPIAAPLTNSLLFSPSTSSGVSSLSWTNTGTSGQILTITSGVPNWGSVSSLASTLTGSAGGFIIYDLPSSTSQNGSVTRTNFLFNVAYGMANDTDAAGAVITSTGGTTNRNAKGLSITSTGTGTGTAIGLNVTVSSGTGGDTIAALFNGGKVGIGTTSPQAPLQIDNLVFQPPIPGDSVPGAIIFNSTWDFATHSHKVLAPGPINGILFEPWHEHSGTDSGLSHGPKSDGGIWLYAAPNTPGPVYPDDFTNLILKPSYSKADSSDIAKPGRFHLEIDNNGSYTQLLDYQFPTSSTATGDWVVNNDGLFYIHDKVFIGTQNFTDNHPPFSTTGFYELSVNGSILTKEIVVDAHASWSDFVFKPDYKLMPLNEVESFVKTYSHLPDIPSAKEVEEKGQNIGSIQAKLLQKVEEMTLYVIELQKENSELRSRVEKLENVSSK